MLEPQSTALFLLLMVAFAGLIWWIVKMRYLAFRVLAACVAFSMAMLFGAVTSRRSGSRATPRA
jgi:hypothetical protein